ncbi:MAG: hypothetical protein IRZ03_08400 [Acidobacterium ailaaui]|nr:hypothetical protein [Pseudacidobacterium ailaaui]
MRPKKPVGKAGEDDVPKSIKEGIAINKTEKRINELNRSGKNPQEKLEELLREDY